MAADFQNQFQEAMREAEMADLKKQVDDLAHDVKSFDPLKDVRSDLEATSKDIERSLEAKPEPKAEPPLDGSLAVSDATPAAETAAPVAAVERSDLEPAGAEAAKAEPAAETAQPDSTERPA
jgi:sec-independent protein translocase protein TatB